MKATDCLCPEIQSVGLVGSLCFGTTAPLSLYCPSLSHTHIYLLIQSVDIDSAAPPTENIDGNEPSSVLLNQQQQGTAKFTSRTRLSPKLSRERGRGQIRNRIEIQSRTEWKGTLKLQRETSADEDPAWMLWVSPGV